MRDQDDGVDPSIHLEPIEPFALPPLTLPPRRRKLWPYLLIAGAIVLSLSSALAILITVAARINASDENVSVAQQRDPASERSESAQVFRDFDATRATLPEGPANAVQSERGQIESFFRRLESFVPAEDAAGFREHVDFDRMIKRIELTGNLWKYSAIERRYLRTELKNSVELTKFWHSIQVVAIVAPPDESQTRIVYAFATTAPEDGSDLSQYRFWLGRKGDAWKLYDWERLDLGLSRSREWGLLVKYHQTPEMGGFDRWSTLVSEASAAAASAQVDDAKAKLRLAEAEMCPAEFADYRWLLTGFHWISLNEPGEAERCYANIQQPDNVPGMYYSLMNINQRSRPAAALKSGEQFEAAVGPNPELLTLKADLLSRLNRRDEAIEVWKQLLRMKPEDVSALAELFLALPADGKDAFRAHLDRASDPAKLASDVAASVGYRDYRGLSFFVTYLDQKAPGTPVALNVAGLAKQLDGQNGEAAALFRRAFEAEPDAEARKEYVSQYFEVMAANGDVVAAAAVVPEPAEVISAVLAGVEEDYISITDVEHQQLLEVYAKRCPEIANPLMNQASLALVQDRYVDAERLARAAMEKLPAHQADAESDAATKGEGEDSGDGSESAEAGDYVRASIVDTLAASLSQQGRLKEAYETGSDRRSVFANLTRLAISDRRWDDARELLALHRAQDPDDPWLHFVEGELAANDKQWDAAIRHFQAGMPAEDEPGRWQWIDRLATLCIKTDRWLDYYRTAKDREATFSDLADRLIEEENWSALAALIHEHRLDFSSDPRIARVQADAAWEQDDFASYCRFAQEALKCRDEEILPSYQREQMERRRIGAMSKDELTLALEADGAVRPREDDVVLSAVAAATAGDLVGAERFAREVAASTTTVSQLYLNDDAGRIFLGPEFRKLQRDFPVESPFRGAPSVAVYLFDKPWKVEATDVAAALASLGAGKIASPEPLSTLGQRVTRGFALRFDEGSIWVVCGDGKFNDSWKLDGNAGPLAGAVNNGRSWLAVGTAGWTARNRRRLAPLARRLVQALANGEASAFCVSRYDSWDAYLAFDPALAANGTWLPSGSIARIADEGFELVSTDTNAAVTNTRRVERSLRDAVRSFESTPNSKLEVWMSLASMPTIDALRLDVSKVEREYGGLHFEGTLVKPSVLVPELVAGLPMRFDLHQICAWRLNDGEVMYRRP